MWNKIRLLISDYRVMPQPAVPTLPEAIQPQTHAHTHICKHTTVRFREHLDAPHRYWNPAWSENIQAVNTSILSCCPCVMENDISNVPGKSRKIVVYATKFCLSFKARDEINSVFLCFSNDWADTVDILYSLGAADSKTALNILGTQRECCSDGWQWIK